MAAATHLWPMPPTWAQRPHAPYPGGKPWLLPSTHSPCFLCGPDKLCTPSPDGKPQQLLPTHGQSLVWASLVQLQHSQGAGPMPLPKHSRPDQEHCQCKPGKKKVVAGRRRQCCQTANPVPLPHAQSHGKPPRQPPASCMCSSGGRIIKKPVVCILN